MKVIKSRELNPNMTPTKKTKVSGIAGTLLEDWATFPGESIRHSCKLNVRLFSCRLPEGQLENNAIAECGRAHCANKGVDCHRLILASTMLLTQLQFDTRAHYLPLIGILWLFGLFAEEQTTIQAETKRIKSKLLFGSRIEYAHADKHCPPTNDRSSIAKDLFESVRC
ncbi:hypothetical protein T4D_649 [Trichinella pseudospiralis]|uniref:Uncharacterized protein n=1 Tax=Trichinella pseudospiralis TaxID=6337 RepID=A0A0V1FYK4_TRIPS|nr:hypothetical protein T4D_649 [Trichinella pseudospiralis]